MAAPEIPGYLTVFQPVTDAALLAVISLVVFSTIQRARLADHEKWRFGVTIAVTGFAWLLLTTSLAVGGMFLPGAIGQVSAIPPAILLPILVFPFVLTARMPQSQSLMPFPLIG